jgi:hypothetical protein
MRQAILILILVGCATNDDLEEWNGVAPQHDPDGSCPGGGTGGGGGAEPDPIPEADPNPIPAPKDCTQEASRELCLECCDWNVDKVWGERCRRLPRRERRTCWEDAERRRGDCQRGCPIVAITVTP